MENKEMIKFYVKISQFYEKLGMKRKSAFMLRNAAI